MRPEPAAVARQGVGQLGGLEDGTAHDHRQAQPGGDLQPAAGGQHVHGHRTTGGGPRGHLGGALEVAAQLLEVVLERVAVLVVTPEGAAHRRREAERPPEPEVDPPGVQGVEHEELLGDHERLVQRQHHPARPDPDADVRAPTAASSTAGVPDAMPGTAWCSATQNRS